MGQKKPVKDFYEDFESVWEEQFPVIDLPLTNRNDKSPAFITDDDRRFIIGQGKVNKKDVFSDPSQIDLRGILLDALRSI